MRTQGRHFPHTPSCSERLCRERVGFQWNRTSCPVWKTQKRTIIILKNLFPNEKRLVYESCISLTKTKPISIVEKPWLKSLVHKIAHRVYWVLSFPSLTKKNKTKFTRQIYSHEPARPNFVVGIVSNVQCKRHDQTNHGETGHKEVAAQKRPFQRLADFSRRLTEEPTHIWNKKFAIPPDLRLITIKIWNKIQDWPCVRNSLSSQYFLRLHSPRLVLKHRQVLLYFYAKIIQIKARVVKVRRNSKYTWQTGRTLQDFPEDSVGLATSSNWSKHPRSIPKEVFANSTHQNAWNYLQRWENNLQYAVLNFHRVVQQSAVCRVVKWKSMESPIVKG